VKDAKRRFSAFAALLLMAVLLAGCAAEPELPTAVPTAEPTEIPTQAPTEVPTAPPTEPQPEHFVLTFVGDCTLGYDAFSQRFFPERVGEDYGYPLRNVIHYFEEDDYTLANLEGVLGEKGSPRKKTFVFRGDGAYTQILTGSSVEGVTLANNHARDYGDEGYQETRRLLEEAGVAYVEDMNSLLVTTDSGLKIGVYGADSSTKSVDREQILEDIRALSQEAELIICAFHWGTEGRYYQSQTQTDLAHDAIDAGAHIIWGHHPHVLQPVEEYNGGIIFYSLGNFAFGGNYKPKDLDTALMQQEVIRDVDGTVTLGELTVVPCSVSSAPGYNNFQPTPYEPGSREYDRVMGKLGLTEE